MDAKSITVNSKLQQSNYSAISSLPRHILNQIKSEGELYLSAPTKCQTIWKEMRKNDFVTNAQLSFTVIQRIFDNCRSEILQLLKISNEKDFFELYDQDCDGQQSYHILSIINEDEQIMVFSSIKEKMQQVATHLLKIQEYVTFKALMKEVRVLERNIADYQNELRQKIYSGERTLYKLIGKEKLEDFYDIYYQEFKNLDTYKENRRNQLRSNQERDLAQLEERLSKDTELMKVKPKKKLKDLQTSEKLVSLEERVEEALDYRKELNNLEKNEQERVQRVQRYRMEKQRSDLLFKQEKEREQLELKLQETEYKLIIQMKKDYDVLLKKINLHTNEISRIQGLATKMAMKKGVYEGEAKRTKQRAKLQNNIIGETKSIGQSKDLPLHHDEFNESDSKRKLQKRGSLSIGSPSGKVIPTEESEKSPKHQGKSKGFHSIKKLLEDTKNSTQFYIRKKYGADLPVNFQKSSHNVIGDQHEKIEKFLSVKRKSQHDILPPITQLYDENLYQKFEQAVAITKSDEQILQEREEKRAFINAKLFRSD